MSPKLSVQDSISVKKKSCDALPVNYNAVIKGILHNNCSPCHDFPGSGGINLDNYQSSVALAKSGELLQVIAYTPGDIQMPPPPQKQLDSCEIKALTLWVKEGCPQN